MVQRNISEGENGRLGHRIKTQVRRSAITDDITIQGHQTEIDVMKERHIRNRHVRH